jgi:hypothetical protein
LAIGNRCRRAAPEDAANASIGHDNPILQGGKLDVDAAILRRSYGRDVASPRQTTSCCRLVFKPTEGARELVWLWINESKAAKFGDNDQTTLMLALTKAHSTSIAHIPIEYCATDADKCPHPVILHDSASRDERKVTWLARQVHRLGVGALIWPRESPTEA